MKFLFLLLSTNLFAGSVIRGNFRIETVDTSSPVFSASEVLGSIAIFTSSGDAIRFPNLEKTEFINIESDALKTAAFPKLQVVDTLFLQGNLEDVELPNLRHVGRIIVKAPYLKVLHLPKLQSGRVHIFANPNLSVMAPFEVPVERGKVPAIQERYVESRHQKLRPTGHAVAFGSVGNFTHWYPRPWWWYGRYSPPRYYFWWR